MNLLTAFVFHLCSTAAAKGRRKNEKGSAIK